MFPLLAPKVVFDLILGASLIATGEGMKWIDLLRKDLEKERE